MDKRQINGLPDLKIQALVDGELDKDEARAVMAEIIRSPELLDRLEELVQQKKQLQDWWSSFRKDC